MSRDIVSDNSLPEISRESQEKLGAIVTDPVKMESLSEKDRQNIATARAEALAIAEEAFNKLDLDGNGEVDKQEVQQLASQGVGLPDNADPALLKALIKEFFADFDADRDGKIQKSMWLNFYGRLFDSVRAS